MATETILQLGAAIGLNGNEWLEIATVSSSPGASPSYPAASKRVTSAQIALLAALISPTGPTGVVYAVPITGQNDNYTASGEFSPTTGFAELTPTGACSITGWEAGFDGQILSITNLSTYVITLKALNAGSLAANRFRLPADLGLTQNNSKSFKYSATIGIWVSL